MPYHVSVPSFGDWGFVLASRSPVGPLRVPPAVAGELRFLDGPTLAAAATFPRDVQPLDVEISTLDPAADPRLHPPGLAL